MKRISLLLILTLTVFLFTACCYRINEKRASTASETKAKHETWAPHDPLMGDPPQEPQGLYSVFDTDISTRQLLQEAASKINKSK